MRECKICGREFPATTEFFYRPSGAPHLLMRRCKSCHIAEVKQSRDPKLLKDYGRWYTRSPLAVGGPTAGPRGVWRQRPDPPPEVDQERKRAYQRAYVARHRDRLRERARKYRAEVRADPVRRAAALAKQRERNARYYACHREAICAAKRAA